MIRTHKPLPSRSGAGLKPAHYRAILDGAPDIGFFEVHAENFMGDGGPPHRYLEAIRARYPLSIHGVALSIGGAEPLSRAHLARLKALLDRYEPAAFSEHLAWSVHQGVYLNDLLPIPYTEEALAIVCDHVDEAQDYLRRRLLLENPSTYLTFTTGPLSEVDFLREVSARTGCFLLLDVNNIAVSAANHGFDPTAYIDEFPLERVKEVHLAGYARDPGGRFLIDAHGSPVAEDVWRLYARLLDRIGPVPTLIEWDNDVPAWPALEAEATRAEAMLTSAGPRLPANRTRHETCFV